MATRRTHIVRCYKDPEDETSDYVDVEVLEAISFKVAGGKEVVINIPQKGVVPTIKDDTGGNNGKDGGAGTTRLSHMKRITSDDDPNMKLDVEVIDVLACRDTRGEEWILDMKATTGEGPSVFDTKDGGGGKATRRGHSEKVSSPFGEKKPTNYITVQRNDAISFRTIQGKELIVVCPSGDDPNDSTPPRADTFVVSPKDYDPTDDSPSAVKPPKNKDPNHYVKFVKGASGIFTKKKKIQQGPLWWIRKISGTKAYLLIVVTITTESDGAASPGSGSVGSLTFVPSDQDNTDNGGIPKEVLLDTSTGPNETTNDPARDFTTPLYFVWSSIAPLPTLDTYDIEIFPPGYVDGAGAMNYSQQFARLIFAGVGAEPPRMNNTITPPLTAVYTANGWFGDNLEFANNYAAAFNGYYVGLDFIDYYSADHSDVSGPHLGPVAVTVQSLDIPGHTIAHHKQKTVLSWLVEIPSDRDSEMTFSTSLSQADPRNIIQVKVFGYSDTTLNSIAEAQAHVADNNNHPVFGGTSNDGVTFTIDASVGPGSIDPPKAHNVNISISDDGGSGGGGGPPPEG
jgi:hypothetical protein